jgi:hypothetical protein
MKGNAVTVKDRQAAVEARAEDRRKIFKELCMHVSAGYSVESFPELSRPTIEVYLKKYPLEFDLDELDKALRKGRTLWEGIGKKQAMGECLGNSRSWFLNMVNRYSWRERVDIEAEHRGSLEVQVVSYASKKRSRDTEEEHST